MYSLEDKLVLFFCSLAFGGLFILGLQFIKMFINSKPPGRRMVMTQKPFNRLLGPLGPLGYTETPY